MRYVVYLLDMWGHVPADCVTHDCPCMIDGEHADDHCDCHEDCNQQFRVGEIELDEATESDSEIITRLIDGGFLKPAARDLAVIDDYSDGPLDVNDNEGRRLFHLIPKES